MRSDEADRASRQRRCNACGGAMHHSHVEYAGRGLEVVVRRCAMCGATERGAPVPRRAPAPRSERRRRPPVDEGPPPNPVIDPETARRLRDGA